MKKLFTFFFVLALATMLSANNITVSNLSLTGQNTTSDYTLVKFDISWDNSWRTSSAPNNWDAAWVFVKYKVSGGIWNHATLHASGHTAPAGSTITPSSDGIGAFIYRSSDGTGTFNKTGVQLRWNYGANGVTDNEVIDIQVFAIEMVYVPQGSFYVGNGVVGSDAFYKIPQVTSYPYQITSEGQIDVGILADRLDYPDFYPDDNGDRQGPIPAAFPKGYNDFYCMKYEISQQGYVDFLNTLTYTQQATRTAILPNSAAGTYLYNTERNKIKITTSGTDPTVPAIYATDYPYVACNYLCWGDLAAYLDWSGLCPMTELEFEKAGRGTMAVIANEYVWGNADIASGIYTLSNSGANNEVIATNYSITAGNAAYWTTIPYSGSIIGPVRVGIFAGTGGNTGRVTAGATYYGIMEMSGNLHERPVTVGNPAGRAFTGTHGNGAVDTWGGADVTNWPGSNGLGAGFRGGSLYNGATALLVSYRGSAAYRSSDRSYDTGGRGVRGVFAPYIGQSYCGGIIFYIDGTGQHGLIAATSNQSTGPWGCEGTSITGADGTTIGTGNQNTIDIMAGCSTAGIAARLCGDLVLGGFSDWYLPSKDELNQLYINRDAVGGFVTNLYYQSSSESGATYNWMQDFSIGAQYSYYKHFGYNVRAIRAF
jgi:formylglycine-generating enzyme required for sulfatase activity